MGYMLRYHAAFRQIESWARSGLLGDLYAVRGHMSTYAPDATRGRQRYPGGIAFQLASHMIDPTLTLFGGRPLRVTSFLRNDATPAVPEHADNTLVVLEFERGMAVIDIAAMEAPPAGPALRGLRHPGQRHRPGALRAGPHRPPLPGRARRGTARRASSGSSSRPPPARRPTSTSWTPSSAPSPGAQAPDRTLDHELLVEETLHRAVGTIAP